MTYKVELIDKKDSLSRLEASESSIKEILYIIDNGINEGCGRIVE